MRRMLIAGMFAVAGLVIARALLSKLHERLMEKCEGMFERMPDTFPPKKMMSGIEELRVEASRILELLEARTGEVAEPQLAEAATGRDAGLRPSPARWRPSGGNSGDLTREEIGR